MLFTWLIVVVLVATGAMATYSDLTQRIIPNRLLLPAGLAILALSAVNGHVLLSLAGAGLLILLSLPGVLGGLGMGDVKYLAVVGLGLGPVFGFIALVLSALLGTAWNLPLAFRKGWRTPFAFGPFIALGSVLVALVCAPYR